MPFDTPAANVSAEPYLFPSSPTNRTWGSTLPSDIRDGQNNNIAILKAQYQHNFSSDLYGRLYYYTLYSDWLQNGPVYGALNASTLGYGVLTAPVSRDYELDTHTKGASLQFGWQANSQNLVTLTGNYTTANVMRLNNSSFGSQLSTAATSLTDGTKLRRHGRRDQHVLLVEDGRHDRSSDPRDSHGNPIPITGAAAAANAQYLTTYTGLVGTYNTVRPVFTNFSLTDEFRPNSKLDINVGLRFESFQYNLSDSSGADYKFWFNQAANTFCYDL